MYVTGGGSAPGPIEWPPYIRGCPTGNQCRSHPDRRDHPQASAVPRNVEGEEKVRR